VAQPEIIKMLAAKAAMIRFIDSRLLVSWVACDAIAHPYQ